MNYLIIPAYQPDLNLVKLVRLVHAKSDLHIIVVDDGSDADKKVIFDKYAIQLDMEVNIL